MTTILETVSFNTTIQLPSGEAILQTITIESVLNGTYSDPPVADPNTALLISGATIDILNRYVDISFDPNVYHSTGGGLLAGDLQVVFAQNGGVATGASITTVTTIAGGALAGGEQTVRVNLSFTGNPSGVEMITIKPSASGSYRDSANNFCSSTDTTGAITVYKELDAMYKAVILAELTASETTPGLAQRLVENAWFVSARAAGWLTELDGIHLASFDQNHIRYNFVGASKSATIVGAPVLTKYLGQRGATSAYIDFNWNASVNGVKFLQNDRSFIICVTNNGQDNNSVFGARGTDSGANFGHVRLLARNTSNQAAIATGFNNSGNEIIVSSITDSIGVYQGSRNAASGTDAVIMYKDGANIGADVDTSSTPTTRDFFGNAVNNNNTPSTSNITHDILIWAWGSNLRTHVSSISTVTNTLRTDLAALVPNIIADKLYSWLGQSNMDRADTIANLTAPQTATYVTNGEYLVANGYAANCYVWWDEEWQPINPGVNGVDKTSGGPYFSPLYAFALEEAAKYPTQNLYFIHHAIGGSGMKTSTGTNAWIPGGVPATPYEVYQAEYNDAIAALTSVTTYMACYWGQGEADANVDEARSLEYEANEQLFIAGILADTAHDHFIVMQIHADLPIASFPWKANVRAAKVANHGSGQYGLSGDLISIDDLARQVADPAHLTNDSAITLAQRMSAAYP